MNEVTTWALTNLAEHGVPILMVIAFIGSLGIPFPITLVIVAAGAFTRSGLLDWRQAGLACLAGAMLADSGEYWVGRLAHQWLGRRFGQKSTWRHAQSTLNRQGVWAILMTRFWLTPLAPPINVIAGSRYPFVRFLLIDFCGQFLWVLLYGGLGYLFAAQWRLVSDTISVFSGLSVVVFLAVLAVYLVVRRRRTRS